jgi:hypothetical protein
MLLWVELLRPVSLPTASLFPKKKDIANGSMRAICDVGATNKHAGLLEGRESLYPKLKQY